MAKKNKSNFVFVWASGTHHQGVGACQLKINTAGSNRRAPPHLMGRASTTARQEHPSLGKPNCGCPSEFNKSRKMGKEIWRFCFWREQVSIKKKLLPNILIPSPATKMSKSAVSTFLTPFKPHNF